MVLSLEALLKSTGRIIRPQNGRSTSWFSFQECGLSGKMSGLRNGGCTRMFPAIRVPPHDDIPQHWNVVLELRCVAFALAR